MLKKKLRICWTFFGKLKENWENSKHLRKYSRNGCKKFWKIIKKTELSFLGKFGKPDEVVNFDPRHEIITNDELLLKCWATICQ